MKLWPKMTDPVTLKRIRRFRRHRRAYVSLWLLVAIYAISLGAELLCNDKPIYVRFKGHSYFPVLKYYSDDTFTGSGKLTRPDYKELSRSPLFQQDPTARMFFTPVPFGPLESIDPKLLAHRERVSLSLVRIPRVGTIDIDPGFTVLRGTACGYFFGGDDDAAKGLNLADHWSIGSALRQAVATRFANQDADTYAVTALPLHSRLPRAKITLSRYVTRTNPPRSVRLVLREENAAAAVREKVAFTRNLTVIGKTPDTWIALPEPTRAALLKMAGRCFDTPVPETTLELEGREFSASFEKKNITWPYPPVRGHWLGIDAAGRDVLARILYGLRISMTFGFLLVLASMLTGTLIGALQGFYGGKLDIVGQRVIEIWSALPFLYIMILMGSIYGRSFILLLFCYGIFNWIGSSYYMRAEFLRLRHQPFVDAARCMGIKAPSIICRHILPNAITPIITFFPFSLVGAIGSLAALDYLGFGLPPPTPSWGELLHQAQQFRWAWWLILYPSLALFVVMLLGVFIGEGVRDAFDPRPFTRVE